MCQFIKMDYWIKTQNMDAKKIALFVTAIIVALMILGAISLAISFTSIKPPSPPVLTTGNSTEQETKKAEIANYKELILSLQVQRTNLYDFVILKTLLPLFNSLITAVLAYIFAKTTLEGFRLYISKPSH